MAKLIIEFFKQGNRKALKFLGRQLGMSRNEMVGLAKHTVKKETIASKPKKLTIAEKIEALANDPEKAKNFLSNMGRVMDENVKKHR